MKKIILIVLLFAWPVLSAFSLMGMSNFDLGKFNLSDYNGKAFSPELVKEYKAVAYIFVSTRCPVSNAYNARMEKLYRQFKSKGIQVIGINSNRMESGEEVKKHAAENGLSFPIFKDPGNKVADYMKASFTPEVYVFNNKKELVYHGRIDDSRREKQVQRADLHDTFKALLEGKAVPNPKTKAFGCSIKRVK